MNDNNHWGDPALIHEQPESEQIPLVPGATDPQRLPRINPFNTFR